MSKKRFDFDKEREIWKKQMEAKGINVDDNSKKRKDNTPEWLKKKMHIVMIFLGVYFLLVPARQLFFQDESISPVSLIFSLVVGGFLIFGGIKKYKINKQEEK